MMKDAKLDLKALRAESVAASKRIQQWPAWQQALVRDVSVSFFINASIPQIGCLRSSMTVREHVIAHQFLTLPFRHQIYIAKRLCLITDSDADYGDAALFRLIFKRAAEKELLGSLWDEIEKLHDSPVDLRNPFKDTHSGVM